LEFEHSKRIVGLKNLTINEPFFQGHFPQVPLMPGVLQIEAMAQLGGMLVGEDLAGKIPVLATVNKVKFRRGVVPGDQLIMEMFLDRLRSNFGQVHGTARVDGELACEATIRFGIVPSEMLTGQSSPTS
jgi:3-hydroxyacyl-[acyl-carrier-protein] dehydratase